MTLFQIAAIVLFIIIVIDSIVEKRWEVLAGILLAVCAIFIACLLTALKN